jgi:hypothetical protein
MAPRAGVTLQINVAPRDAAHAEWTIPHQLRAWGGQVDEVLFSLDGRGDEIVGLLDRLCAQHPAARVSEVDYSPAASEPVAKAFFGGPPMPTRDTKGAPIYPYFHGLFQARNDLVLHLDSDMMLGGGSQTWVAEALDLLAGDEDALWCGPLPGPPRADGSIDQAADRVDGAPFTFRFDSMSTRIFLVDRRRLRARLAPIDARHPVLPHRRVKARLRGRPPYAAAEMMVTAAMRRAGVHRIDFLGRDPGMWSLHPVYRSPAFYRELPALIERVERGDVPDRQRGRYDVDDSLFDFSGARRRFMLRRLWA